jgi:Cu+-exporting ATPase
MRIFGKRGFYIKNSQVIENLSKIDTVVFDKTGTITQSNEVDVSFSSEEPDTEILSYIKSVARQSTHPLSVSLTQHLANLESHYVENFKEVEGKGVQGTINNHFIQLGSGSFVGASVDKKDEFSSRVYVAINKEYLGFFSLENKYRDGLDKLIEGLKKRYDVHLISGDNESEKDRLLQWFKEEKYLHFNQQPADKLAYIERLQEEGKNVLMIGDGLNDAGALNQSNVGITIADDIYNFSPACDGIMESGRFKYLLKFIQLAKSDIKVVKTSFIISLVYNTIGLGFAINGLLTPIVAAILMPISSVTVVVFVTLATNLRALYSDKSQ